MKTTSRRRLVRTVNLRFFQDDASGEYGLAHKETLDGQNGSDGFNAFWDGMGLFHDVWEHAHEHIDPHFRGQYAMNIGGEMAAMGAMHYYIDELHVHNRLRQSHFYSPSEVALRGTFDMVSEVINGDGSSFSNLLECGVPKQKETDNSELEWIIEEYARKVQALEVHYQEPKELVLDGERPECYERDFKESVTQDKIADLHRYGYRMAGRLVPNSGPNHSTLTHFREFWDKFCKNNSAEEMAGLYRGVTFKVYRDSDGDVSWVAEFERDPYAEAERIRFDSRNLAN